MALYEPGDLVRIVHGPFADMNGVVEDVNEERETIRVSVLIFGRSKSIDLAFSQVEKA